MPKGWEDKLEIVGYVAKAGGLQGYLVSKEHVDKYNINTLDDFKRPEVKKAFDANGDGKADLTACLRDGVVKRLLLIILMSMISMTTLTRSRLAILPAWRIRWRASIRATPFFSIPGHPTGPLGN